VRSYRVQARSSIGSEISGTNRSNFSSASSIVPSWSFDERKGNLKLGMSEYVVSRGLKNPGLLDDAIAAEIVRTAPYICLT
jgi:hypothetical protein